VKFEPFLICYGLRSFLLLILTFTGISFYSQSFTTIDASNSPYYILTDTTINRGDTLLLSAGAELFMGDSVNVQVEGVLIIKGDSNNLASVKPMTPGIGWGEFKIYIHVDSLHVENAYIEDGRFLSFNSVNHFNNVTFVNNQNLRWNDAISRFIGGELKIEECNVYGSNKGEGFLVHLIDNPQVLNCYFQEIPDAVEYLNCNNGRVGKCQFFGMNDDAIDLNNCYKTIIDSNLIVNVANRGMEIGSDNFGSSTDIFVYRNILVNCAEGVSFKEGSNGLILNNTFHNNRIGVTTLAQGRPNKGSSVNVLNSIFHDNDIPIFSDDSSSYMARFNSSSSILLLGDSNLFEVPGFNDPLNLDYSLTKSSKCIDAGQKTGALDPDGTYADLGAVYFHQDTVSSLLENSLTELLLMPNPVVDQLTIIVNERIDEIEIYNISGQLQKKITLTSSYAGEKSTVNVSDLRSGMYVVILTRGTKHLQQKFIKL
jgi:hypothetical protein